MTEVDFSSIEALARLSDTQIEAREICDKWILLTYDLPNTEAGNKARAGFLANAKLHGATMFTESVYLLPWTKHAEVLALRLARVGDVCVWTAQTTDENKASEITRSYDKGLEPHLMEISQRLDKISEHMNLKHYKRAHKMMEKTENMLNNIEQAIIRRGSAQLYLLLTLIKRRFEALG